MRSGFFNSNITGYDENNNPIYDRAEEASFFAEFFADFIGNGVYPNPSTGMQVLATTGLQIKVQAGSCFINGYRGKVEEGGENITLDTADINFPRIDRIVARLSIANREITLEVLKGTPASNPIAIVLTRNSNIYEIALADVTVGKGASTITQANITDTRLNSSLCGMVSGVVDQLDTTSLFNQYQSWFNEMKNTASDDYQEWFDGFTEPSEQEFTDWFDEMKDQLSEDAAGNLQLQIDELDQNGIIVSPTEPVTDRRKVWMQKGKNLINNSKLLWQQFVNDAGYMHDYSQGVTTDFIPVKPNTTYVYSQELNSSLGRISQYDKNMNYINYINGDAIKTPFTTGNNTYYIKISSKASDQDMTSSINHWMQLEQGSVATNYEAYVEPSTYIKNDNDEYEEFINTNIIDTGWVDMSSYVNTDYFSARPNMRPEARRMGDIVYWRGEVYCKTRVTYTNDIKILSDIPDQFTPSYQFSGVGCRYRTSDVYNIFIDGTKDIKVNNNDKAFSIMDNVCGFQLSNISGYPID